MAELSLNQSHGLSLSQFLRFSRSQLESRKASILQVFDDQKKRLKEAHYTNEQVKEILATTSTLVEAEAKNELINMMYNSFLLIRQLMRQAELGGLTLNLNLSEAQNVLLIQAVAQFEKEMEGSEKQRLDTILKDSTLLDNSMRDIPSDYISSFYQTDLKNLTQRLHRSEQEHSTKESHLTSKVQASEALLNQQSELRKEEQKRIQDMEKRHLEMEMKIAEITKLLSAKEAELEKKFQSSNTYHNMQKILQSKNAIIARLREGPKADSEEAEEHDN